MNHSSGHTLNGNRIKLTREELLAGKSGADHDNAPTRDPREKAPDEMLAMFLNQSQGQDPADGPKDISPKPDTAQTGTVEDIRDARIRELEERQEQKEKEWRRYEADVTDWMTKAEETIARAREVLQERARLTSDIEALKAINHAQEEELAEYRRLFDLPLKLSDIAKRIEREAA